MASLETMYQRLENRFIAVNALPADAAVVVMQDTFEMFGYSLDADVPFTDINRLLAYASAELAMQVAINAASYFKYTDGEESVDKSMISKEYREIAKLYRQDYAAEATVGNSGASFAVMPRRDRAKPDKTRRWYD